MLPHLSFVSTFFILVNGVQRWHTSQIALEKLYDLQKEHFNAINDYLNVETKRLEDLKSNLAQIRWWRDLKLTEKNNYLYNHINGFKLMTRIYHRIEYLMSNKKSIEVLNVIDEHKDLSGDHIHLAQKQLRRLQKLYEIPAVDMAAGRHKDVIIGDQLDACECYIMSKYCFEDSDNCGSLDWAIQTYYKWKKENQPKCVDIDELQYYIVSSSVCTGFDFTTIFTSKESFLSKDTANYAQYLILMKNEMFKTNNSRTLDIFDTYRVAEFGSYDEEFSELCKHGVPLRTLTKDSKCRYQTKNSFYRMLMPFKEEDINKDPLIKIYHDVLYDDEIVKIKSMTMQSMTNAEVHIDLFDERYRSGQVGWITNEQSTEELNSLNSRIESFTGLSTKSAEEYQIVNYGLGGHYISHLDSVEKEIVNEDFGNRFATVLFYMSSVNHGGHTVFPMLDIVSPAEKGAALFWYNLHWSNGSIHDESLHGSCPILKGNKWIFTRWLREEGQNLPYNWKTNYFNIN